MGKLPTLFIVMIALGGVAYARHALAAGKPSSEDQYKSEIDALRKAGARISPADFQPAAVPDDQNQTVGIRQAEQVAHALNADLINQLYTIQDRTPLAFPLTANDRRILEQIRDAGQGVNRFLDEALCKPKIEWHFTVASPVVDHKRKYLHDAADLCRIVWCEAILAADDHDDAEALRRVEALLALGNAFRSNPDLVAWLVSVGFDRAATDCVQRVAPILFKVHSPDAQARHQIAQMIANLLKTGRMAKGLHAAMEFDRMEQIDVVGHLAALGGNVEREVLFKNALVAMRFENAGVKSCDDLDNDFPQWKRSHQEIARMGTKMNRPPYPAALLAPFVPAVGRMVETYFDSVTERRLAALSLAIRSYELDHQGKLPPTLKDLVPAYIPSVPMDGLADHAPIAYDAASSHARIWSVGRDGADNGGQPPNPERGAGWNYHNTDRVIPLLPATNPAAATGRNAVGLKQ